MGLRPTQARLATHHWQRISARHPADKAEGGGRARASQDLRRVAFGRDLMTRVISRIRNRDAVPDATRVEQTNPRNRARARQQTAPGSSRRAGPACGRAVLASLRVWGVTACDAKHTEVPSRCGASESSARTLRLGAAAVSPGRASHWQARAFVAVWPTLPPGTMPGRT
jgi:hypothetical protein